MCSVTMRIYNRMRLVGTYKHDERPKEEFDSKLAFREFFGVFTEHSFFNFPVLPFKFGSAGIE